MQTVWTRISCTRKSEPQKTTTHGLSSFQIEQQLKDIGFDDVLICPNWFFAQALMKKNPNEMKIIYDYQKVSAP